jgi:hypothetical protein
MTDTEIQPPIHAAIPDGEVDEYGELSPRERQMRARYEIHRATLLARLTALEAENAALKAKNETQGERLHDMADSLQFASNERAALKAEVEAKLGIIDAQAGAVMRAAVHIYDLKAEVAEARAKAIEDAAKIADQWVSDLVAAGDQFDQGGDIYRIGGVVQDVAKRIRSLSTSQGEQER